MTNERKNEIWAMLPCDYQTYVKRWYQDVIDNDEHTEHIFEGLFGTHNLTGQAEEKPKEPKFHVGDLVYVSWFTHKRKAIITEIDSYGCYIVRDFENNTLRNFEDSDLEPYTEPKEDVKTSNESGQNPLDVAESVETSTKEDAYFAYRLDLTKEIAIALINTTSKSTRYGDILAHDAVKIANVIVKRLKETDNAD